MCVAYFCKSLSKTSLVITGVSVCTDFSVKFKWGTEEHSQSSMPPWEIESSGENRPTASFPSGLSFIEMQMQSCLSSDKCSWKSSHSHGSRL